MLAVMAPPGSTTVDDRLSVARLIAGDETALHELYDRLSPMVFGIARRVVADQTASEDVCQEVFVQLWSQAGAIDLDRCSLRGWVSVLAHRRAVDWVRRAERARRREERADASSPEGGFVDLADGAVADDRARRARAAVASLPADQRRAVELAYWGGRSYREVAVELGVPEGTAKSRLRLALSKLATMLGEEED